MRTDAVQATLLAVSDPDSPRYGQHLSNAEVHALVAPTPECAAVVASFLSSSGIDGDAVTPNGDFVTATATVAQADALLQVGGVDCAVRCGEWGVDKLSSASIF